MKKLYFIFFLILGICSCQYFFVERSEYIAGENRYYTLYDRQFDNEINTFSSSAYNYDTYNLDRIKNRIVDDYREAEEIRQNILNIQKELKSSLKTKGYYAKKTANLILFKSEIQKVTKDLRLQERYLKELRNYIIKVENETKSIYLYQKDIMAYLSNIKKLDSNLNQYSVATLDLTSFVETAKEKIRQKKIQEQEKERLTHQKLLQYYAKKRDAKNHPTSTYTYDSYYSQNYTNKTYKFQNKSKTKYYINSFGNKVQSPTYYHQQPSDATALCRDGTYSFSKNRRGTCSGHGGVRKWLY